MLYLFYGSDTDKVRTKAFAWVEAARKKEPNLSYVRMAKEDVCEAVLDEVSQSGSLFAKRTLTLIDDPFASTRKTDDDEEGEEKSNTIIEEHLEKLAASENVILILAPKLPVPKLKKISSHAKMAYVFDAPVSREPMRGFNSGLVNALGARSKEKLWLEIVRALRAGDAPEMLHGLLHWKARDLLEKGSRSWTVAEARALSMRLITLLQESRRKGQDLGESLERFALSI